MNEPTPRDAWRLAALTMMAPEGLQLTLQGKDAATWLEAAAACGLAEAHLRLGRMLLEGEGAARDPGAAFACFQRAAANGDADAHNMLGCCFENGWGTKKDYAAAVRHYRIAAEADLDWAQYNLGHMLLSGTGVLRDRAQAFALYRSAAAQGHVRAMNLVGRCCEQGWGIAKDICAARTWYRRSAEGGYFRGAYNYADMLANDGCIMGARWWFARAIAGAPEQTRNIMITALSACKEPLLRVLAKDHP